MKIDLMFTKSDEAGLISDTPFESPVSGVIFEQGKGKLFLEFADMDSKELNVPVTEEFQDILYFKDYIYIGVIEDRVISDARRVPLAHINDGAIS